MVKGLKRRLIGESIALDEAGYALLLDGVAHVTISAPFADCQSTV